MSCYSSRTRLQVDILKPGRNDTYPPDRRPINASDYVRQAAILSHLHAAHLRRLNDIAEAIVVDTAEAGWGPDVAREALALVLDRVRKRLPGRIDRHDLYPRFNDSCECVTPAEAIDRVCVDLWVHLPEGTIESVIAGVEVYLGRRIEALLGTAVEGDA